MDDILRQNNELGAKLMTLDLDLERLPSGKFETNALVLALATLAYNILRYIGQNTLIGPQDDII